ncbi:Peptidase C19, ubiquitin carboxyl-terminal hydrolase 2 [Cynara cardunculus var. scolymus]|uniref:Peptidase C19, ubiquitin carboxyl-terminal hydrolase 2 n=1 Tax=Cynara cardunculus var. scolymus TaxID=59895 RepID=A0A103XNZ6_CYNCS|nr:Peptidase C19, ubiquitin carboxyl-terminal hydrolase 2 [Cynara cardunculus var. scolymus]
MAKVLMVGGSSPELSPEEERLVMRDIAMAGEAQTKEGDTFCLITQRSPYWPKTSLHLLFLLFGGGSEGMTEILTKDVSLTELSPEEEKRVISGFAWEVEAQAKEGDTYHLISWRWWRIWSAFVNHNPATSTNEGSSLESGGSRTLKRPPSIDNSDLICESASDNSTIEIYDTLVEGTDYILVPEEIWNQFYAWYGGGPALARKVITRGSSQTELTVEVYPLRLQLHLKSGADQHAIRMSRKETIGELHRKACQILDLNSDKVHVWDYYGCRKHILLNDLDKTLDDANIQMDQDILVEVIDHSGGCTSVVQENGSTKNVSIAVVEPARMNNSIGEGSSADKVVSKSCNSELSQFQNLSFAPRDSDRTPTSLGVSTRGSCVGLIGLLNFGNTCFMNSAIQCLVHTPEFARYFRGDFYQEINWHNPLGMEGELAIAFGELLRLLWAPGRASFAPRTFKAKLARFAPQFGGHNQHDSQELLAFLLDGLHEDLNRVKQKPYINPRDADGRPDEQVADEYWANHIARNDSIIVDVCQGQYKSTLICPVCDKISVTFDPFMYLSLPLQSATPRTMMVTVFSCDGSVMPATCTVTVPKEGRCRDLIHALSRVQGHLIRQFLEDPLMSLSVIKDDDRLTAYKIPKETSKARSTTWKPYGTPLIFPVSSDATITRGDIQLIAHTMLSPLLKHQKSNTNTSSVASNPSSVNNGNRPYSPPKENSDSILKLPLKLVDGNNTLIDISVGEEKIIRLSSSSVSVLLYIDWSPELLKKYETHYLENLPEVFKSGHGTKKARIEPLYCPQCKERRQASKKLDLWRLPEVLVIHLKRFSYSRTVKNKLETFVNFPLRDFDLTKYVANKNNSHPQVYELYASANHYGSMGSGHYTAHVKLINENKWYNFDDSHVSTVSEDDVKSNAAYVLFYRRVKPDDALLSN